MLIYVLKRLASGIIVFLSVTGLIYFLYNFRGGFAIAFAILGPNATLEQINSKITQLGLDQPLIVQYVQWLGGLFDGTLSKGYISQKPVAELLATRVPVTLSLIFLSLAFTVVFSVLLGVLAANRGGIIDRGVQGLSVLLGAVPGYWLALILVIIFALNLRLFPATGYVPIEESFTRWFGSVFLPSIALALGSIFGLAVWIRSSIIDMRRQDWVRTLRSRGLNSRAIMYRHVLRNAAAPTVQILGLQVIGLLGGTIIVEKIFNLPGLGLFSLANGIAGDVPAVLGAVTVFLIVIVGINILVDIVNGFLNPKVRIS